MNLYKFLSRVLKDNQLLLSCYNFYFRVRNGRKYKQELSIRSQLSIFDYKETAKEMPFYPTVRVKDSNYYGHAHALSAYAGVKIKNIAIEHGIYLGNRVTDAERLSTTKSVFAMSMNRVNAFKKNNISKPIVAIGPYIHYVNSFYNEESLKALKKKYGRTLLVFPTHSTLSGKVSFDLDKLIITIDGLKSAYQTVMVCIHHNDIIYHPEYTQKYEESGYVVVSAGHKFDDKFLPRLKSIILLSDFVITNDIGTQVGYCTYLKKPLLIIKDAGVVIPKSILNSVYDDQTQVIAAQQREEIINAYSKNFDGIITAEQSIVAEKYWGLSQIKSHDELRKIIEELDKL